MTFTCSRKVSRGPPAFARQFDITSKSFSKMGELRLGEPATLSGNEPRLVALKPSGGGGLRLAGPCIEEFSPSLASLRLPRNHPLKWASYGSASQRLYLETSQDS